MAPFFWQGGNPSLIAWTPVGAFWGVCALALLLRTWRGWRQGVARELVGIAALILGWLAGRTNGSAWEIPVQAIVQGIVVYIVVIVVGRFLFKKASDKSFGPTRVISGSGGAFVGFLVGCFSVWFLIIGVRLAGAIEQAQADGGGNALFPWMGGIKKSLESGWVGDFVRFTDPLPPWAYTDLNKATQVLADPRLQQRLLDAPALNEIAADPKVASVRKDPDVMRAIERQDYLSLARNAHVQAVLNDPRLMRRFEKVDFSKLLDQTVKPEKKKEAGAEEN